MTLNEIMHILNNLLKRDDLKEILDELGLKNRGITYHYAWGKPELIDYFLCIGNTDSNIYNAQNTAERLNLPNYKSMDRILVDITPTKVIDGETYNSTCYFDTVREVDGDNSYQFHPVDFTHDNWELGVWRYIDVWNDKKKEMVDKYMSLYINADNKEEKEKAEKTWERARSFQELRIYSINNFTPLKEMCSEETYNKIIKG